VEYVPFGEVFLEEKNAVWNTPFLFNGKELDKETGMSYYGARYYEPKTSVWISVDPLAEKYPSMSPYAYCINNPINVIDPDGRDIIILIYGSYNTDSGAGHVSFAIGSNDNNLKYYSHYRQKDGGGITVSGVRLNDILGNFEKNNLKHGQKMPPVLAIRIKTTPEQDKLLIEKADTEIKDTWLLLNSNCTGTAKDVVEEISGIDAGFAFLINTPNEFAEDLLENNEDKIKSGVMSVIKGNEKDYLENERSAIPAIIFGKKDPNQGKEKSTKKSEAKPATKPEITF
jgi:RHS repeat-associated protein